MDFKSCLIQQIKLHPSLQPQDIVKLCYQGAFGAGHLLEDPDQAYVWLEKEYNETKAADIALCEEISENVCRINLASWKYRGFPVEWLFRMFAASASVSEKGQGVFEDYLSIAEELAAMGLSGFNISAWQSYLADYRAAGMKAVHHSEHYRKSEKPSYRIINCRFLLLLPILEEIAARREDGRVFVIAIDGRAASGKSTLAKLLITVVDADIIQMDDFFLPPTLRTDERFLIPGGNVHYERFSEEVVPNIAKPEPFSYRVFDCGIMDYNGRKSVENKLFRIVEGSYGCHPIFGRYADLTVFLRVDPEEQMKRILSRNGEKMAELFRRRWIPLEETYFDHYSISEKADLRL